MSAVRVLVADDHPVVRAGLVALLGQGPEVEVVAVAADGQEALALARVHDPDVVLMDLRMPELDGVAATGALVATCPRSQVLILTTYDSDADLLRAVEAGARGYLLKDAPKAELVEAIRAAARGETVFGPRHTGRLVARLAAQAEERPTARERQILERLARGASNQEIAGALRISEATVKTHLLHVFAKLGVKDRTAAVTAALQRGYIALPEG